MKKMEMNETNKGITLIALVVTIIIIIILAGVSTNLLLSKNGIFQRAKEQKEEQKKAQILEELELAKGPVTMEGEGYTSLEKYLEAIKNKKFLNRYEVTSVELIDEANAEIWIDGKYKYTAGQIGIDVIINAEGVVGKLKPQIKSFTILRITSNTIEIEVTAKLAEEYEFYIGETKETYEKAEKIVTNKKETAEIETVTYTYGNTTTLEEGKKYCLKVIAKNSNGQDEKEIQEETIPTPTITILEENKWSNKQKSITITPIDGYTTKYTTDGTNPNTNNGIIYTGEFTVSENCTIKAVHFDRENQSGTVASKAVTQIDKADPSANIVISGATTQASLPITLSAKVTHEDETSGIDVTSCKYILNTTSTEKGKNPDDYPNKFDSKEQNIEINPNTATNWYLHILTVDNAGNKKETIKEITITEKHHSHTGTSSSGGGCYTTVRHTYGNSSSTYYTTNWQKDVWGNYDYQYRCDRCGTIVHLYSASKWEGDGKLQENQAIHKGCPAVITSTYYELGCGKTGTTLEGYHITY